MEDTERLIRILGDLRFYLFEVGGKSNQKQSDAVHSSAHSSDAR